MVHSLFSLPSCNISLIILCKLQFFLKIFNHLLFVFYGFLLQVMGCCSFSIASLLPSSSDIFFKILYFFLLSKWILWWLSFLQVFRCYLYISTSPKSPTIWFIEGQILDFSLQQFFNKSFIFSGTKSGISGW